MDKFEKFIMQEISNVMEEASFGCLQHMANTLDVDAEGIIVKAIIKAIESIEDEKVIEFYKRYCMDC